MPVGLVYDTQGRVVLDPDRQVQDALWLLFATYEAHRLLLCYGQVFPEAGSVVPATVALSASRKGELVWGTVGHSRVLQVLRNPRYAGAFFHGRTRSFRGQNGRSRSQRLPADQWHSLLPESHAGYISWDQYQRNQEVLRENAGARPLSIAGTHREEGQLSCKEWSCAVCGGRRMTVSYHVQESRVGP